jgi:hypothetical protein
MAVQPLEIQEDVRITSPAELASAFKLTAKNFIEKLSPLRNARKS